MSSSRKRGLDDVTAAADKKPKAGSPPAGVSHGLYNQGSTCYLNSVLQLLYTTSEFHDSLQRSASSADQELRHFFDEMKTGKCETRGITQWLEIKNVHQQRDAVKCLEEILNRVSPHVSQVFRGELMYTTKCDKGCVINDENVSFWTVPVSLSDSHTATVDVQEKFNEIFEEARFSGDDLVHCESCRKKLEATSTCEMVRHPQVLMLLLKRFELDYTTRSYSKCDRSVAVPLVLQAQAKSYELCGIVNHRGSLEGGHYTSTVLSSEDDTWYSFDDTRVEKIENPSFGTSKVLNSSSAYLIAYRASEGRRRRRSKRDAESKRQQQKSSVKEERRQDAPGCEGWAEDGGLKQHQGAEPDSPFVERPHSENLSKGQKPDGLRTTPRDKTALVTDQSQASKCLCDILRNPILIAVAVVTCIIIGIVIVVLVV